MFTLSCRAEKVSISSSPSPDPSRVSFGAERLDVEVICTPADLLVNRERDPDHVARRPGAPCRYATTVMIRDAGLVVRAEGVVPSLVHDVVADACGEAGSRRVEHLARVPR